MKKGAITLEIMNKKTQVKEKRNFVESKLISIGTTVRTLNNENQTEYRVGTIEFYTASGELKKCITQIWESVVDKMTVGEVYLTEYRKVVDETTGEELVFLNTGIVTHNEVASVSDFAF